MTGRTGCATWCLLLTLGACTSPESRSAGEPDPLRVVRSHIEAFNAHDAESMSRLVAREFIWFSVGPDSVVPEAVGRDALRNAMESYFEAVPSARSVIEDAVVSGPFVAIRERAYWNDRGSRRSASTLGIYEVRNGSIRRVWYHAAGDGDEAASAPPESGFVEQR